MAAATSTTTSATTRPTTCGAWVTAHQDSDASKGRLVTCKRLPRHAGDCRAALTVAAANRAAKKVAKPKAVRVTRKETVASLAAAVEDGSMTASAALSKMAALLSRKPATTKSSSKTAQVTKAAAAVPTAIVFGAAVTTKTGKRGRVTKVADGKAVVRFPDGKSSTFVVTSLTRVAPKAA